MTEHDTKEEFKVLDIEQIGISDLNPRKTFDEAGLDELARDLQEKGQLQPILVRPVEGKERPYELVLGRKTIEVKIKKERPYELVLGERRFRASLKAGRKTIEVKIKSMSDRETLEAMLSENIQRQDLEPLEEARAILGLVNMGMKQTEVAEKLHKSKAWVSERLALLYSPEDIQEAIKSGLVAPSTTKLIKGIEKSKEALAQISEIVKKKIADNEPTDSNAMKVIIEESYEAARNCYVDEDEICEKFLEEHASGLPHMFRAEKEEGDDPDEIKISTRFYSLCREFIAKLIPDDTWTKCKKCKSHKVIATQWGNEADKCLNDECFTSQETKFIQQIWEAVPDMVARVQKEDEERAKKAETGAVDLEDMGADKWVGMEKGGKFAQCKNCLELKPVIPGLYRWEFACVRPDCCRKLEKKATRDATIEATNEKNEYREKVVEPLVEKIMSTPELMKSLLCYHLLGWDGDWRTAAKDILKFTKGEVEDEKSWASSSKNTIIKLMKNKGNDGALRFAISRFILGYSTVKYFDPIDRAKITMKEFEEITEAWNENTTSPSQDETPEGSHRELTLMEILKAGVWRNPKNGMEWRIVKHTAATKVGKEDSRKWIEETSTDKSKWNEIRQVGRTLLFLERDNPAGKPRTNEDGQASLQDLEEKSPQAPGNIVPGNSPPEPVRKDWSNQVEGALVEGNSMVRNGKTIAKRFQDPISNNWYVPVMIFDGTSEGHAVANAAKRELSKELGFCRVMKRAAGFVIYKREGQSKGAETQEQLEVGEAPGKAPEAAEQGA